MGTLTSQDAADGAPARTGEDGGRQVIARAMSILRALETAPGG